MAEVFSGKDFLSYFRRLKDQETEDAAKLRFITEKSQSEEMENEATVTVDGVVNTVSDGENTVEFTSLAHSSDRETIAMWKQLRNSFRNKETMEYWNVNAKSLMDNEVEAEYMQGFFTSFEISYPADAPAEVTYSYAINGKPQEGKDMLTEEQVADLEATQYEYSQMAALESDDSGSGGESSE